MFDPSAPHIIILVIVVLLLFGSSRLPGAAQALGKSMHIFKKSVAGLSSDDEQTTAAGPGFGQAGAAWPGFGATATPPPALPVTQAPPAVAPQDPQQAQLQDLQRQVQELQQQAASGNAGQTSQPS
jgi:sec-independent protein translocase protein TatA